MPFRAQPMTKRRKRLLLLLTAAAVLVVLALPAVHWRLIGWVKREPFFEQRPISYYVARVRDSTTRGPDLVLRLRLQSAPERLARNDLSGYLTEAIWGAPPESIFTTAVPPD